MTITDEDCLAETLAFNEQFEAAAASRPTRGETPDATVLATLRRNRLGGNTPPVRLPQGQDRVVAGGVKVRAFMPDHVDGVYLHIPGAHHTRARRGLVDRPGDDHAPDPVHRR
jgi:hypothetical protein